AARFETDSIPVAAEIEEKANALEALEADLAGVREELDRTERVLQDREREHRYGLSDSEKIRTNQSILGRELEVLRGEKGQLQEAFQGTSQGLAIRESEARSLRERIEGRERDHAGLASQEAALGRRFFEAKSGLDLVQEKMNGLGDQIRAGEKRKEAAGAKIQLLEADILKSDEDQTRLREEIAALRESSKTLGEERAAAETGLEATEGELEKVRRALEGFETIVQKSREAEEAAKNERVRHEIRKAEVDRDLVNLDEMCWQELKKTLTELRAESTMAEPRTVPFPAAEEPETEDLGDDETEANGAGEAASDAAGETAAPAEGSGEAAEAVKRRRTTKKWRPLAEMTDEDVEKELEESRETINRFKAVNLMAEEEFIEQKKRFEFLSQQRQDLRDSITSTVEAIRRIDEESKGQFLMALEQVNKNFAELFSSLFKGGNAEVKLLEPDNPLESGVEIVAQPPGKRVQNLSLLSGGEKSLTSLAFLFALFRYRPSPFCFLDEVDAALDDVNLARFLDLLKTIKNQTQFILITHNYK
ncbi:MAG: AAA family ATPase, partial [Candidatus Aminicenantales bacterium]